MKFSSKKFTLFLIIILFIFFCFADFVFACNTDQDCSKGERCLKGKCIRSLEVEYPKIPGGIEVTDFDLPKYVVYVFYLSIILIGLVIFTMIVYHGIRYLTAIDKPAVLKDAIDGILKAFLGAIILLSAVLIFKTINPQLVIFELGKINPLGTIITPGIYVCNYKVNNNDIKEALNDYIQGDIEKQIEAAKKLRKIMKKSNKERCLKANFSGNFENFALKKNDTMFIMPKVVVVRAPGESIKRKPIYEYGIVLHEKYGFRGQCQYYPKEDGNDFLYTVGETTHQIEGYSPGQRLPFDKARSFTIFKKPTRGSSPEDKGVTLYTCFDYNKTQALCPKDVSPVSKSCKPEGDADIIFCGYVGLGGDIIVKNSRSITVNPKNRYFAIVYTEEEKGECAIITRNDPDILDMKLPFCSLEDDCAGVYGALRKAWHWITFWTKEQDLCVPCIKSMRVIKGEIL